MRLIQISDTHISTTHRHFVNNTDRVQADLQETKPDLIVHTGDVSMDGAAQLEDLEVARQWNLALPAEVLSIPGNHDVGDHITNRPDQPVSDDRLAAWQNVFGNDRWARDMGGWQLIGLNAMLLGTGHAQEDEQFAWLASTVKSDKPIALFTHKPLCIDSLTEGPRGYWTVPPEPRARLIDILAGKPVKMIASGHLHIQRETVISGVKHVWGPAASFVVGAHQEDLGGERTLGYVEHTFASDTVTSRFVRPDGLVDLQLDPVRAEIYGG